MFVYEIDCKETGSHWLLLSQLILIADIWLDNCVRSGKIVPETTHTGLQVKQHQQRPKSYITP